MSKSQVGLVEQPREYSMVNPETVTARCYLIDKKTVLRKNMTFFAAVIGRSRRGNLSRNNCSLKIRSRG